MGQHTPTAAQTTQLGVLQAALVAAQVAEASALTTYNTAKIASKQAALDLQSYSNFIQGNKPHYKPNVISGNADET